MNEILKGFKQVKTSEPEGHWHWCHSICYIWLPY